MILLDITVGEFLAATHQANMLILERTQLDEMTLVKGMTLLAIAQVVFDGKNAFTIADVNSVWEEGTNRQISHSIKRLEAATVIEEESRRPRLDTPGGKPETRYTATDFGHQVLSLYSSGSDSLT